MKEMVYIEYNLEVGKSIKHFRILDVYTPIQ